MQRDKYIDQWRGISVLLVIAYHLIIWRFSALLYFNNGNPILSKVHFNPMWWVFIWATHVGTVGVCIFFVISGYLITHLLVKEEQQAPVSLPAFYTRRVLRIMPALGLFIGGMVALDAVGAIQTFPREILLSSLFLCNTPAVNCGHFIHLWSLAVEEQFYLIWPPLFILLRWRNAFAAAALGVALVISTIPSLRVNGLNNGEAFACICAGVLYALSPQVRVAFENARRLPRWFWVGLLVFLAPFLSGITRWSSLYPAVMLTLPFIIVATVLARGAAPLPAVTLLSGVGLISYSLYLWQVVFTWRPGAYASWFAPVSYLAIPIAWVSYRLVEKPCMNLARRLTARLTAPVPVQLMRLPRAQG